MNRVRESTLGDEPIAIVGLACRFPKAPNLEAFWRVLAEGVDATADVPAERWDADAYYHQDHNAPGKAVTRRAALLQHVDRFDPLAFGISPAKHRSSILRSASRWSCRGKG